jgi:hypothetical protein
MRNLLERELALAEPLPAEHRKLVHAPHYTTLRYRVMPIEIRLNIKGTCILADVHGMDHFCTKLAPQLYNKPRSCVSKIHTPMVW